MLTNKNKHILDKFGDLLTILLIIITNRLYKDSTVLPLGVAWMGMNIVIETIEYPQYLCPFKPPFAFLSISVPCIEATSY